MRITISGAGISGPTLAWFLSDIDACVTIIEKNLSSLTHGENIDISGSALSVIRKMGLLDEVKKFNTTEKGGQFIDSKGRPFALFPLIPGSGLATPIAEFEIWRGDLESVLYKATENLPTVTYLFGTTIQKVHEISQESPIKVELSNGETHEADLLVVADGQWSKLRQQCFPSESVNVVDLGIYIVYWTIPRLPTDNDWLNVYMGPGSRGMILRPDPHGTTRTVFTYVPTTLLQKKVWEEASRASRDVQRELLRSEFSNVGWQADRALEAMDHTDDFYFQSIQQIKMDSWSNDSRVICLGDAAYAPSPLTGAGADLAILGAYVLAGELSKLEVDDHPSKALKSYEKCFRPFVEKKQDIPGPTLFLFKFPSTRLKRFLLHTLLRMISKLAKIKWLVTKFDDPNDDDFPLPQYPMLD